MIKIWSLTIGEDVWSLNKRSLKVAESYKLNIAMI